MKASSKVGLVLMTCYLVAWLDRMAINMAVPFMAKDLAVGADKIGWILSAFFAGYALLLNSWQMVTTSSRIASVRER